MKCSPYLGRGFFFFILHLPLLAYAEPCDSRSQEGDHCEARIAELRPTQMAVGMTEVRGKEKELAPILKDPDEFRDFEKKKPKPTVIGPQGRLFIIDHHHLSRALWDLGVRETRCEIKANFAKLSWEAFWKKMNSKSWLYPYDENGEGPKPFDQLPATILDLRDDPYRSLAGAVHDADGFDKSQEPFAEFKWANFFRSRIQLGAGDAAIRRAVREAKKLAQSDAARHLPGYNGDRTEARGAVIQLTSP